MNLLPLLHVVCKSCVLRQVECPYVVSSGRPCIPRSVCSLMHDWQRYNSKIADYNSMHTFTFYVAPSIVQYTFTYYVIDFVLYMHIFYAMYTPCSLPLAKIFVAHSMLFSIALESRQESKYM